VEPWLTPRLIMATATTVPGLLAAEHPVDRGPGHPEHVCDLLDGVPPLAVVAGLLVHRPGEGDLAFLQALSEIAATGDPESEPSPAAQAA
jgi:hypothetical protein